MIDVQIDLEIAVAKMCHGKVNAMDIEFSVELTRLLNELADNDSVRAVVLVGNAKVFSAGVDLKRLVREPPRYVDEFLPALSGLFRTALTFRKPMLGAISGHALAGGCVLASACDYRVLARDSQIGMPELRVGLALPAEGIETFRFAVAPQFLQQVVTSGASFSNEAALQAGFADELETGDRVLERAFEIAIQYAQIPAEVFQLTKEQIRQPVLERINKNRAAFAKRIEHLWHDPAIRESVATYVCERL